MESKVTEFVLKFYSFNDYPVEVTVKALSYSHANNIVNIVKECLKEQQVIPNGNGTSIEEK